MALNDNSLPSTPQFWDQAAATFDDEPDHGLRSPLVREAWLKRIRNWLPPNPASILDIGCGTGTVSVLLAELGHQVAGIDFSPAMIAQAKAKARAAEQAITFMIMDAARPRLAPRQFDALICRHLLWALPASARVLRVWSELLRPGGRLILVEGCWSTGAGLSAQAIVAALPPAYTGVAVHDLSNEPALWGGSVTDERFAVLARLLDQPAAKVS